MFFLIYRPKIDKDSQLNLMAITYPYSFNFVIWSLSQLNKLRNMNHEEYAHDATGMKVFLKA